MSRGRGGSKCEGTVAKAPGNHFLRGNDEAEGPGVLTTLLRSYIEKRDRESLDLFFKLLYDEHGNDIAIQVHSYGPASDITVQEVISDSVAKLLEDVTLKKYRKAPESAGEHLKYLLRRRFIDRRRYWDQGHEDVSDHREKIVDPGIPSAVEEVLGREHEALVDERFERAFSMLSPQDQSILRLKLEGLSYPEIEKKLGIAENSIWKATHRALERLLVHLAGHAPTMALRIRELKEKAAPVSTSTKWPTLEQIRRALPSITERVRRALERLHFGNVPEGDLARELGEETLGILLRRGYDLLESRFKVSFPEAFERAKA
jgi:RNA polymerase sigma factor (sigma-70 family)